MFQIFQKLRTGLLAEEEDDTFMTDITIDFEGQYYVFFTQWTSLVR